MLRGGLRLLRRTAGAAGGVRGREGGRVPRSPQDLSERTYHGKFDRPEGGGFLSWDRPSGVLDAAVRAADHGPYPNEFGTAKIALADGAALVGRSPAARPGRAAAGTVLRADGDGAVVATADGAVRLTGLASRPVSRSAPPRWPPRRPPRPPTPRPGRGVAGRRHRGPGQDAPS
ncbi:hypothetical protein NKH77_00825 [Streptomyces sp. M19]